MIDQDDQEDECRCSSLNSDAITTPTIAAIRIPFR